MPSDASGPAPEITQVAASLRHAISCGAIAPGEWIRAGSPDGRAG
jgi:hypothetical protein